MKEIIKTIIKGYQKFISPYFIKSCKYYPTCSEYTHQALEEYGVMKGLAMGIWRILRCNPFSSGGYDPVINNKGKKTGETWKTAH